MKTATKSEAVRYEMVTSALLGDYARVDVSVSEVESFRASWKFGHTLHLSYAALSRTLGVDVRVYVPGRETPWRTYSQGRRVE